MWDRFNKITEMEVSNEIKEDIRKTQTDLKNAIRIHQVWVARLQDDESNIHFKTKVQEAERDIIAIGQAQKLVVDRLRRELELYQQRLKSRSKQVNVESDNRYVAQQLRDHQMQYKGRIRSVSLLKPSVLNEIHVKIEHNNDDFKENNISDSENDIKLSNEKENNSESDEKMKYPKSFNINNRRTNFTNALNKVKAALNDTKEQANDWQDEHSDSNSSPGTDAEISPSPSPPPLPGSGETVSQQKFLRLLGLLTHFQKEALVKKRSERKKRSTTSTNKNDFLYGNFEMLSKRKKLNQFPYLQSHNEPPQTRSAKLRKQQDQGLNHNKSSREGSPSGSSTENKSWSNKPAWAASLPPSVTVEPVYPSTKKVCHGCSRNDVRSLLVWCTSCSVWQHTGCGPEGNCSSCNEPLPDPADSVNQAQDVKLYRDKLAERKRLQEKNIELCIELRKLEARAASLKENLDEHNAEKRQLLADQIKTQRNLQKLLDFISQFKETSISIRSTSISDTGSGSDISKSYEE